MVLNIEGNRFFSKHVANYRNSPSPSKTHAVNRIEPPLSKTHAGHRIEPPPSKTHAGHRIETPHRVKLTATPNAMAPPRATDRATDAVQNATALAGWRKAEGDAEPFLLGRVPAKAAGYANNPFGAAYVLTDANHVYFADAGTITGATPEFVSIRAGNGVVYRVAKEVLLSAPHGRPVVLGSSLAPSYRTGADVDRLAFRHRETFRLLRRLFR
jgi:hypothetical protein